MLDDIYIYSDRNKYINIGSYSEDHMFHHIINNAENYSDISPENL